MQSAIAGMESRTRYARLRGCIAESRSREAESRDAWRNVTADGAPSRGTVRPDAARCAVTGHCVPRRCKAPRAGAGCAARDDGVRRCRKVYGVAGKFNSPNIREIRRVTGDGKRELLAARRDRRDFAGAPRGSGFQRMDSGFKTKDSAAEMAEAGLQRQRSLAA